MKKLCNLIWLLLMASACSKSTNITERLDRAELLLSSRVDSALYYIKSIDRTKIVQRKVLARYALLYSQALDKNYIDVDRDTLICIAKNYFTRRGSDDNKALVFFYSGRIYENRGIVDSAIMEYARAEEFARKTDNIYLKGLIANALAAQYAEQQFCSLAQSKYREAAGCFLQIGHKTNALYSYWGAINNSETGINEANSEADLQNAGRIATELGDTTYLLNLARIYAANEIHHNNYKAARNILWNSYVEYNRAQVPSSDYFILSDIYFHMNQFDSAYLYLGPQLEILSSKPSRTDAEVHYLAARLMQFNSDYREAYVHLSQALEIIDSLYFAEKKFSIPELKERFHNEQLVLRNEYLKTLNKYQGYITVLILLGIVSIIVWLVDKRKKSASLHKKELADKQVAICELQEELDHLKEILDNNNNNPYLAQILERRIAFIKNTLEATAYFEYDKDLYYSKVKQFLVAKDNATDNNILFLFRDMLDSKQPGILNFMQKKYGDLTEDDINLYCLICLDVSLSAICLVLGYKPKTIYNYRNQLRGKLNIRNENATFFEHFVMCCAEVSEQQKIKGRY